MRIGDPQKNQSRKTRSLLKSKIAKSRKYRYSIGQIHPTPFGTWRARLTLDGKQIGKSHKTLDAAKNWIDTIAVNAVRNNVTLNPAQYLDAQQALAILPPGVSLLEAARAYKLQMPATDIPVSAAMDEFLQEKRDAGRKKRSVNELKYILDLLPADSPVASVTPKHIADLLKNMHPTTRNNHLRGFRNFFGWALARGYTTAIPTSSVTHAIQDDGPPEILTLPQVHQYLAAAIEKEKALIRYIAVQLFAGLRKCEADRLNESAIDLKNNHIHVGAGIAKTRQQRFVTIHPVLLEWLHQYPPRRHSDPLRPVNWAKRLDALRKAAKISPWPHNAHRHSFASYHLAMFHDPGKTAYELGHRFPDLLYKHYRNLVSTQDAEKFFQLTPKIASTPPSLPHTAASHPTPSQTAPKSI
jgi:integrase